MHLQNKFKAVISTIGICLLTDLADQRQKCVKAHIRLVLVLLDKHEIKLLSRQLLTCQTRVLHHLKELGSLEVAHVQSIPIARIEVEHTLELPLDLRQLVRARKRLCLPTGRRVNVLLGPSGRYLLQLLSIAVVQGGLVRRYPVQAELRVLSLHLLLQFMQLCLVSVKLRLLLSRDVLVAAFELVGRDLTRAVHKFYEQ